MFNEFIQLENRILFNVRVFRKVNDILRIGVWATGKTLKNLEKMFNVKQNFLSKNVYVKKKRIIIPYSIRTAISF